MSTIFTDHTSIVYESKGKNKTVAFPGQRLVISIAKAGADKNYHPHLQQTMATSIPVLESADIDWESSAVRMFCAEYFRTVQNSLIVDRIKATGTHTHSDADIGIECCISYLERELVGDTWSAERVATWFSDTRGDALGQALLAKSPDMDNARLEQLLVANTEQFSNALSSKARISMMDAQRWTNRLNLIPSDSWDTTAIRFNKRLFAILHPVLTDAMDLGLD